jgi:ABC-type transport system involved in cytochrome c biogenesis permease subunit
MSDRVWIELAMACYAARCVLTLRRAGGRLNHLTMLAGFVLHTVFLYLRGQQLHRCPLTNPFEITVFIAWAAVLFYLLIGPSYRVSFLGAFTAPLALALGLIALLGLSDAPRREPLSRSPWVDFHAAIAILACGAFGLAFVTGIMYLIQERQLKTRKLGSTFLLFPPIEQLDVINERLVLLGFGMLTVGMMGGIVSYRIVGHWSTPKIVWAVGVWLLYGALIAARRLWSVRGRRSALGSVMTFALVLATFWGLSALP